MRSFFNRRRTLICCAMAAAFLVLSACGPVPRRQEPSDLYWPLPPDVPRIKYIESIYNEDDIGRVYSLKEKLFGKDYIDVLSRPYGVFARGSKIVVSDIGNRAVFVFDLAAKRLSFLGGDESLILPSGAVQDAEGNTFVVDAGGGRIVKYDARGKYETTYRLDLRKPVAIAINDALGRLYIVDRGADKVVVCNLQGKSLFSFGGKGSGDGKLNIPIDIALDRQGKVYVLDNGNFRVDIFSAEGVFLSKFGSVGDRPGTLANPKGIALDSDGHIYVTDAAFGNFQVFDEAGHLLIFIGGLGWMPGQFHLPGGIAIDENDRIYVADQLNGRIEVFQYLKAPSPEPHP